MLIGDESEVDMSDACKKIEKKLNQVKKDIYGNLTAWQRVQISRHLDRPYTLDYIKALAGDTFLELHGDRTVKERQLYKDVRVDNQVAWQKLHWKTLQTAYRTTPYFEYYEDKIAPIFTQKHDFLLDLNLRTIEAVLDCLHIDVSWEQTTAYHSTYDGVTDYRYLTDAKAAYEVSQDPYYQIFSDKHGFIPNLSILDLLFHEGNRSMIND